MAKSKRQGKGESNGSPKRVEAAVKRANALDLRAQGKTWQEIADAIGWADPGIARRAGLKALEELVPTETRERVRKLHNLRLETLQRKCWDVVMADDFQMVGPDHNDDLRVHPIVATLAKLLDQQARINGLVTHRQEVELEVQTTILDLVSKPEIQTRFQLASGNGNGADERTD